MSDLQNYERLLSQRNVGKHRVKPILFLFLYVTWVCLWTALTIRMGVNAPMLLFIPLTTVGLIWLTWPLTRIEWEYTLAAGTFYVAKIYGKKTRKEKVEAEIRDALLIAPVNADTQRQAEALAPAETLIALSEPDAANVWMLIFEDAPNHRVAVWVEMDEEMLRILRHHNPRVTSRERLTPTEADR